MDRYREKPEREDDDPERLLALETLTLSARAGVAAAAAALGQLHYYDALDAQEAFDVLCKASGNDAESPRGSRTTSISRGAGTRRRSSRAASTASRTPSATGSSGCRTCRTSLAWGRGRWPCLMPRLYISEGGDRGKGASQSRTGAAPRERDQRRHP